MSIYYHLIYVLFKLFKTHGTFFNLSTSNFKLVKSVFLAKSDVSAPLLFLSQILQKILLDKSKSIFTMTIRGEITHFMHQYLF